MICLSLADISFETCLKLVTPGTMAEIRLDRLTLTSGQIRELFSLPARLIATFRPGKASVEERLHALRVAIDAGAAYVDLEWETDREFRHELFSRRSAGDCPLILSWHDYESTPSREAMLSIINQSLEEGAEIAKIAAYARTGAEVGRILSLYDHPMSAVGRILALGMGPVGKITRIAAPLLGAPFTFAFPDNAPATAPGQLSVHALQSIWETLNT